MLKKSVLKIGLLTLGICLITGCMNNNSNEIQEPASNDNAAVEKKTSKNNDEEINKYNIKSEFYKKGNISIEYPQIKTKDGSDDDFTNKWNKILKDELISNDLPSNSEPELEFFNMDYKVKTNNNNTISLLCPISYYFKGSAHPCADCITYNIDISKNKKVELQDDPNFSKYVENIFYDKNYSLRYNSGEEIDKNDINEVKEFFLENLEKSDISKLKEGLKNYRFYYENNKTIIIFEANHACGEYVLAVME